MAATDLPANRPLVAIGTGSCAGTGHADRRIVGTNGPTTVRSRPVAARRRHLWRYLDSGAERRRDRVRSTSSRICAASSAGARTRASGAESQDPASQRPVVRDGQREHERCRPAAPRSAATGCQIALPDVAGHPRLERDLDRAPACPDARRASARTRPRRASSARSAPRSATGRRMRSTENVRSSLYPGRTPAGRGRPARRRAAAARRA